jgi:aminocarboxymuconate-semialdehyde decarboxylase
MILDVHNHYYPPRYLKALQEGPTHYKITIDKEGNPVLHSPGDYNVAVLGHRDLEYRVGVLDAAGVGMQLITFTCPGTLMEEPKRSVELSRLVNDELAEAVRKYPKRFMALGTLPLNDPAAAVKELERIHGELGLPGAMLFGNANGVALHDQRFWPLLEKAAELRSVFFIHPNYPVGVEAMKDYWLMPLVGFLFDTTLAAAGLVFSGVTERFAPIRWVLMHLGGAVPYIAERFDRGYEAFAECRANVRRPPSESLKQFHYDTVNFDPRCLRLAIEFAGVDHLLAGSDYPHMIGSLEKMKQSIEALELSTADKAKIHSENARRLLS